MIKLTSFSITPQISECIALSHTEVHIPTSQGNLTKLYFLQLCQIKKKIDVLPPLPNGKTIIHMEVLKIALLWRLGGVLSVVGNRACQHTDRPCSRLESRESNEFYYGQPLHLLIGSK